MNKPWTKGDYVEGRVSFTNALPQGMVNIRRGIVQEEIEGHSRLAWVKCDGGFRALMVDPKIVGEAGCEKQEQ